MTKEHGRDEHTEGDTGVKKGSIKRALIEGNFIEKTLQKIKPVWGKVDKCIGFVCKRIVCLTTRIEPDEVVFMTYGNTYFCNPKYIAEEIVRQQLPWKLVWIGPPGKGKVKRADIPEEIAVYKNGSMEAIKAIASARIWVDNAINFYWDRSIRKKRGQAYFETWHGSMGIKRVGKDDVKNRRWARTAKRSGKVTDYCISNSQFENMVFRTTHWPDTEILMYGHARNDCLFCPEEIAALRRSVAEQYGYSPEEKIFLYAPTFRDNGYEEYQNVDFSALHQALQEKFGGRWRIFLRMHFHDRKKQVTLAEEPYLTDATSYPDMQELMMIADAGMTDYSSWAYDFVLTRRPMFIFATDLAQYNTERGLYYPLESTPFPVSQSSDELLEHVRAFNDDVYQKKIDAFLQDKGCVEDGHAAERIVAKMKEIIGGNNT